MGVELIAVRPTPGEPLPVLAAPAGVEAREDDRIAGVGGENRLELAREMAVQRPPLERDLVEHDQKSRSRRTAVSTRATDGMYASSICQYGYGTS